MIEPARNRRSEARLRVVNEAGDLYAAASSDGLWIKVGFSTRLPERLKQIDHECTGAPFKLIGSVRSTYRVEQQLHRMLKPFHGLHIGAGKELYPAAPAVRQVVEAVLRHEPIESIHIDDLLALRRWCRAEVEKVENMRAAVAAHRERFEKLWAAEDRYLARIAVRIAAYEAAKGIAA
jgi:hypothetical protein|tara:strand:+ start:213 stop:746 length:534 start_codon:yes stop_codon:yes gene_type:complete